MLVLGLETSCDETAAALVDDEGPAVKPWRVRSNVVASQVDIHREWGGVVPELASRQHVRDICGVVERALGDAGARWADVDALAVTQGPGLIGSLLVGVSFAKSVAWAMQKPLAPVNHLAGHIESIWLEHGPIPTPAVVLVVSGGHTSLYLVAAAGSYQLLGRTRDDAAGEAYDKVAKLLELGYPGGPIIDRFAQRGNLEAVPLPSTRLTHPDRNAPGRPYRFDFSFSGLKTAVLRHVRQRQAALGRAPASRGGPRNDAAGSGRLATRLGEGRTLPESELIDLCASFQATVVDTLLDRTFAAARWHDARAIGVAGGVSANHRLRTELQTRAARYELPAFVPSLALTTDNAAMIAAAGFRKLYAGELAPPDLNAAASMSL